MEWLAGSQTSRLTLLLPSTVAFQFLELSRRKYRAWLSSTELEGVEEDCGIAQQATKRRGSTVFFFKYWDAWTRSIWLGHEMKTIGWSCVGAQQASKPSGSASFLVYCGTWRGILETNVLPSSKREVVARAGFFSGWFIVMYGGYWRQLSPQIRHSIAKVS